VLFAAACVPASITHFIAFEVRGIVDTVFRSRFFAAGGERAFVTVVGMEVVIYVSAEVVRTMEPATGSDEDPAIEPLRAVIAIRGAVVGRNIVVAIGTVRGGSDFDGNLSVCWSGCCRESEAGESCQGKIWNFTHCNFTSAA
jgi:hypothetical protein